MAKEASEKKKLFILSCSPHDRNTDSVSKIMWMVILSLSPTVFSAAFYFGLQALYIILTGILTALICESLVNKVRKRPMTIGDGSAVITGLLLALILPPSTPLSTVAIGSAFSILIGKHAFGGLGNNIFNPALLGRAFLQASFPIQMTTWTNPAGLDAVTSATPLGSFKFEKQLLPYMDLFLGRIGGCIGETSGIAILIGAALLIYMRYIDWRIPVSFLGTIALLGGVFWLTDMNAYPDPLYHILAGGLLFGAIFMATDMVTSPVTPLGTWFYGIGCGIILLVIRLFGGLPEGVMYAILFMNGMVPLINKYTRPRIFGAVSGSKKSSKKKRGTA